MGIGEEISFRAATEWRLTPKEVNRCETTVNCD